MLNRIWIGMMLVAVVTAFFTGKMDAVVLSIADSAKFALTLTFGLTGIIALWLGIMRIAELSGLIDLFAKIIRPVLSRVFSSVPKEDPALGIIAMNLVTNMFGLTNAGTPIGLRAMEALEKLNPKPGTATNAMCTFIALHSANLQLIPTTMIAILAAAGARYPADIIPPLLLSSIISILFAVVASKIIERRTVCSPDQTLSGEVA